METVSKRARVMETRRCVTALEGQGRRRAASLPYMYILLQSTYPSIEICRNGRATHHSTTRIINRPAIRTLHAPFPITRSVARLSIERMGKWKMRIFPSDAQNPGVARLAFWPTGRTRLRPENWIMQALYYIPVGKRVELHAQSCRPRKRKEGEWRERPLRRPPSRSLRSISSALLCQSGG